MDKQLQIAQTFEHLCNTLGYKKATMDRVAAELKMSKKTIYKYFKTKEEVYEFLIDRFAREESELIRKQLACLTGEAEQLKHINDICFKKLRQAIKDGEEDKFSFYWPTEIAVKAFQRAFRQVVESILISGMEKKVFYIEDLSVTMEFIQAIVARSIELFKERGDFNFEEKTIKAALLLAGVRH